MNANAEHNQPGPFDLAEILNRIADLQQCANGGGAIDSACLVHLEQLSDAYRAAQHVLAMPGGKEYLKCARKRVASYEIRAENRASERANRDAQVARLHRVEIEDARVEIDRLRSQLAAANSQLAAWQRALSPGDSFPFRELRDLIRAGDWRDGKFASEKALACVLMSRLAYLHVPDIELAGNSRFKVVPCLDYQFIIRNRLRIDLGKLLLDQDLGQVFTIELENAVLLGIATSNVVLIAVRGTASLYDALIDISAWKTGTDTHQRGLRFHAGFYKIAMAALESLRREVCAMGLAGVPLCFTGHSMGAAVAAICHANWQSDNNLPDAWRHCYVFAMPRFADAATLSQRRQPFHLFGSKDPVPALPPTWMGYAEVARECAANAPGVAKQGVLGSGIQCVLAWINGDGILKHHRLDTYEQHIRRFRADIQAFAASRW